MTVLKQVCDRKEEQVEKIATFLFLLTSLRRWDDQRWWWRYMRKLFLLIIYITWCAVFHVGCGTRFTWRTAQCLHDNLYSTKDYLTIPLLPLTFNGCRQLAWCFADVSYLYNILSLSKFVEISNEGKEFTSRTIELGGHVLREGRVMAFKSKPNSPLSKEKEGCSLPNSPILPTLKSGTGRRSSLKPSLPCLANVRQKFARQNAGTIWLLLEVGYVMYQEKLKYGGTDSKYKVPKY